MFGLLLSLARGLEELPWKTFLVDRASLAAGFLATMPWSMQVTQVAQMALVAVLLAVGCAIAVLSLLQGVEVVGWNLMPQQTPLAPACG